MQGFECWVKLHFGDISHDRNIRELDFYAFVAEYFNIFIDTVSLKLGIGTAASQVLGRGRSEISY